MSTDQGRWEQKYYGIDLVFADGERTHCCQVSSLKEAKAFALVTLRVIGETCLSVIAIPKTSHWEWVPTEPSPGNWEPPGYWETKDQTHGFHADGKFIDEDVTFDRSSLGLNSVSTVKT